LLIALVALLLLILFIPLSCAVFFVAPAASAMPLAPPSVVSAYQQGVAELQAEMTAASSPEMPVPDLNWKQVLVVEAVLRQQKLEGLSAVDARQTAASFVEKHTRQEPCSPGAPEDCTSETVTWYTVVPFDEVLSGLQFDEDQREWAHAMLQSDLDALQDVGANCRGAGWQPRPKDGWVWPVPDSSRITSCFGPRLDPVEYLDGHHTGLDIGASEGGPLLAARDGQVADARWDDRYGNVVRIAHADGLVTLYAHLSEFAVTDGQAVSAGQVIGYVGSTGKSTGPHLHFEVRTGGTPEDPLTYFP
jgi:hypothetical protein